MNNLGNFFIFAFSIAMNKWIRFFSSSFSSPTLSLIALKCFLSCFGIVSSNCFVSSSVFKVILIFQFERITTKSLSSIVTARVITDFVVLPSSFFNISVIISLAYSKSLNLHKLGLLTITSVLLSLRYLLNSFL